MMGIIPRKIGNAIKWRKQRQKYLKNIQVLMDQIPSILGVLWLKNIINNQIMMFSKTIRLENGEIHGDNLFSATKATIPYDLYPLCEEHWIIGTPRNWNDWMTMNVVKMIVIEA